MSWRFKVYQDEDRQFRYRLMASDIETVLWSIPYPSDSATREAIATLQQIALAPTRYRKEWTTDGRYHLYYFEIDSEHGGFMARSAIYRTETARNEGIAEVIANLSHSKILPEMQPRSRTTTISEYEDPDSLDSQRLTSIYYPAPTSWLPDR